MSWAVATLGSPGKPRLGWERRWRWRRTREVATHASLQTEEEEEEESKATLSDAGHASNKKSSGKKQNNKININVL